MTGFKQNKPPHRTVCVKEKDSPHWHTAGLEDVSNVISFCLDDMSRPTEPVKRICYADDITIWASGVNIPVLEHRINDYLIVMFCFLQDNSLLIS